MIGQNDRVRLFFVINDHTDILLDMLQNETICLTRRAEHVFFWSISNNGGERVRWTGKASSIAFGKGSTYEILFQSTFGRGASL